MSREDPKPGRWILPLVVAGLIAFTYVFVNALPEAEVTTAPTSTTAAPSTTSTTTSTTTTTTISPGAAAFIETTDTMERGVTDLAELAQQINDSWDTRDATYTPTREALEDLETQTVALADLAAATEVPNPATDEWEAVTEGFEALKAAAAGMIDGLVNAADAEPRLTALEDYKAAADALENALGDVREAARNPAA